MFDEQKATHMAAFLLMKAGGSTLSLLKLMKLMYLADRAALQKAGFSISSDTYASMHRGPMLSHTYNLMKGKAPEGAGNDWNKLIRSWHGKEDDTDITCLGLRPGVKLEDLDQLSEFDCEIMISVWKEFGRMDAMELAEHTHAFPEWEDPGFSSKEIPLASILRAVGHSEEIVCELVEQAQADDEQDAFLASIKE